MRCDEKGLEQVVVQGRLQLPLKKDCFAEQTGASNMVWVTFTRSEETTQLVLVAVKAKEQGEDAIEFRTWPITEQRSFSDDAGDDGHQHPPSRR